MESKSSTQPAGAAVAVRKLTLQAGAQTLLRDAEAAFPSGQVTLIVGPSGVGKSLLLRLLAGLLDGNGDGIEWEGEVFFGGRDVDRNPSCRDVGVVFQNFALFDEWSPLENVRFAHAHRKRRKPTSFGGEDDVARELLRELNVPIGRRTRTLSGGQRQRLAIARTLAQDPDVILYDEPTSGLDVRTARQIAALIRQTHEHHPQTSIIVTHDLAGLMPIADCVYLFDPAGQSLRLVPRNEWETVAEQFPSLPKTSADAPPIASQPALAPLRRLGGASSSFFAETARVAEAALLLPVRLFPCWRSVPWGMRFVVHYLRLVAGPTAWLYLAVAGVIMGFVATYFTFRFLPYARYTEPLFMENVLGSLGFALYRILVPVLATVLIAARCGAAVASDVGGKSYGQQLDALQTMRAPPERYLLTPILYAFLLGVPLLVAIGDLFAWGTSLVVFTAIRPEWGPDFWSLHFHRELWVPGQAWPRGTEWLLAKLVVIALGIGQTAYSYGRRPKDSTTAVSDGITATILWATLFVLLVHFSFAFWEFA